ncbi:MAG: UDP-glucose/GDP-mannose dehydrogenase family protein [Clostridia bacterium]|nr:UDP-glucose/GDP-mannose dehydrogenase family protein [Clostridia bacterium]MDD4375928.1 UDP-glucose/GDP-mannose dehydrogenase family protein [Clostridia bacterium]
MKVAVAGTGYVGLVLGVVLANVGHDVTCVDTLDEKINMLKSGKSPIYEVGLEELMKKGASRLTYTTDYKKAYKDSDVIFICVGTPEQEDGSANLKYVFEVARQIATEMKDGATIVLRSTVPIGTNDKVEKVIEEVVQGKKKFELISNPEFLAQGTAVKDTLYGKRIVIGATNDKAAKLVKEVYKPLTEEPYNQPLLVMNRRSAEMVKYASNDFLALKISYINEIANLCEELGANIEEVTKGMGYDDRIGNKFLNAGIGYGGSCFPKDTKALHWLSKQNDVEIKTIKACIEINKTQKIKMFKKYKKICDNNMAGKNVAVLGLTFKPETDDLREAPSIDNVNLLLDYGANVTVYDPIGMNNFKKIYGDKLTYARNIDEAISNKDSVFILTEWKEIKEYDVTKYKELLKDPIVLDGRNCYSLKEMKDAGIIYYSVGR